jgi:3',5'-cyclic AMP phosphodiesterase CpdA
VRSILHVSDVHFGPHFLPKVAAGVLELAASRRPDLLIVSGDLTQRAKIRQFQEARAWIDQFNVPTLCVPGNHDVPLWRIWERLFAPYGVYRRHFAAELEPTHEDDELFVASVNSAFNWTFKDGRVTTAAMRRLEALWARVPADKVKLMVMHHHLVPPPRFETQRMSARAPEFLRLLAAHGVEMVFSGHLHQTFVATSEQYFPSGERPILLLHSGTTTSGRGRGSEKGRNTCNWVEIDTTELRCHHLDWRSDVDRFVEVSRSVFPRRHLQDYQLRAPGDGL